MGLRYTMFRLAHELKKRTGLFKANFPTRVDSIHFPGINDWRKNARPFFNWQRESQPQLSRISLVHLKNKIGKLKNGEICYFSGDYHKVPLNDWHLNPSTGFTYLRDKHWTEISDFNPEQGDIKYVWEKARFSWIYDIIRYDQHTNSDSSRFVFDSIDSFIAQNPMNQGPNYVCSQEISLRVLNWFFVLYYYKDSNVLDDKFFAKILNSIYWQMDHVYKNIHFSRIAVRNNHAITETLALYLTGLLFPFIKDAKKWQTKGKHWFEQEIEYQVYEDGTYLQFSMNYHRVVVQLMTWAIVLSEQNGEQLSADVYDGAKKCLKFLRACQDEKSGHLPNYGANDGALFFPLSDAEYRDYRPQLDALQAALKIPFEKPISQNSLEELSWHSLTPTYSKAESHKHINESTDKPVIIKSFNIGGYYTIRDQHSFTFIRCGSHKDRPSQADNLHLDIWINGENVFRDAGTYKYNATPENIKLFFGTRSHNTLMIGDYDQMLKGPRFVWFNWTQSLSSKLNEDENSTVFDGKVAAFQHVNKKITHQRTVTKDKNQLQWEITDTVLPNVALPLRQFWHPHPDWVERIGINALDQDGKALDLHVSQSWYSSCYGEKDEVPEWYFETQGSSIRTQITIKEV